MDRSFRIASAPVRFCLDVIDHLINLAIFHQIKEFSYFINKGEVHGSFAMLCAGAAASRPSGQE